MQRYFIIYKPFQVLSQFTSEGGKKCLADVFDVPKNIYPVGRLDYDSEGLLILTDDTRLNHLLLSPKHEHEREYWVQVEGSIAPQALDELTGGVTISIDGKQHTTLPCKASLFTEPPQVFERNPPIRFRKEIPVSWVSLSLVEGKNRQVRRMTAKVGFPTLRLIRYRIERLSIQGLAPGEIKELSKQEIYKGLLIQ
ncbi:pseudouridine synthase [Segetibacter aerophilus]|uniref:Pseudouridine synthase n=1 Tax=Segetibacter aerophilus TaxID=670293 RepID=A0A512BG68_9BACT|nr:pseudouridine synthase [Segetibacter aerophilus]GEO10953.1 pseudouridine synthase [Segetibacter aerophilus]